ncbi:hypothetical protein ABPG72_006210 [Tetrahymena utriculariae]
MLDLQPSYYFRSFLNIPMTNILIANTISDLIRGSSIVYYLDMETSSGSILNVVKRELFNHFFTNQYHYLKMLADYLIIQMDYILSQDEIVIANDNKIIVANPYTLKSRKSVIFNQVVSFLLVPNRNYIVVTLAQNKLIVIDTQNLNTQSILDNYNYIQLGNTNQYYTQLVTLQQGEDILICSDSIGLFSWIADFDQLTFSYNGYINDTDSPQQNFITKFTKHPQLDILIVGGINKIQFIQIISIQNKQYQTLQSPQNLLDNSLSYVENISYQSMNLLDYLVIGDTNYLYIIQFNINTQTSQVIAAKTQQISQLNKFDGYQLITNPTIVYASNQKITFFNFQTIQIHYNLSFPNDYKNRRFMLQNLQNQQDFILFVNQNSLLLNLKTQIGNLYSQQKDQLQYPVLLKYNSFYKVKNCNFCYFIKSRDSQSDYITFTDYSSSITGPSYSLDIVQNFQVNWDIIQQNLDPFMMNNYLYVGLAFQNQALTQNQFYSFQLIQLQPFQNAFIPKMYSLSTQQNKYATCLTIADYNNDILYGIDQGGNVYKFQVSTQTLMNQYFIQGCTNPSIGDLFVSGQYQFLILSCSDQTVISYDLNSGFKSIITQLSQVPFVLSLFNDTQIVGIGNNAKGTALIYKFNAPNFDFLIEVNPGKNQDVILGIDFLIDGTFWLQFSNSNLFIPFNQCIANSNNCLVCQQNFYFKIQNGYDQNQTYGKGLVDFEYRTSQSFVTAMIKSQIYQEVFQATKAMTVSVSIDSSNPFSLSSVLLNFDFSNIISLLMQCTQCEKGQYFTLKFPNQMIFQNYLSINFNQVSIDFSDLNPNEDCGITFNNIINSSTINEIKIISSNSQEKNCNQIQINNSTITISNYSIVGQDFSQHNSIISTINSGQITLVSFSLFQNVLGRNFSIISQLSSVFINLDQINIQNNVCAQNVPDDSVVSSLFSASLFSVSNFNITDNNFCNTLIFTTVASIQQQNQIFKFNNLIIHGNQFVTKTTYILFNALYSMLSKPDHQVIFTNLDIQNNKLIISNALTDQQISSFISTSKILNVALTNINFVNQNHIFLTIIDNSNNVQIVNTNCTNEQSFNNNSQENFTKTAGCLYFTEVSLLNISTINILNKNTVDENLIKFESFFAQSSQILIDKANITGINQTQKAGNAPMNPIYLMVMYDLQAQISNSIFQQNTYTINENTQDKSILSTTGIGAHFLTGTLNIQKCTFFNSSSNSQYNYIYILGDTVNMNQVNFQSSSYSQQILNQPFLFKNYGGNLYLQINYINLTYCQFSQSTSQLGSFIYAMPFSTLLQMYIQDSIFSEGYASVDGGAIYFYSSNKINFNCKNCSFIDIYTMNNNQATSLGFESSVTLDTSRHKLNFNGGIIKNIFGNGDNAFIALQAVDITMQNYQKITIESINPLYLDLLKKIYTSDGLLVQPAQLINIQSSTLQMTNCNVDNWNQIYASQQPLLINSQQSQVALLNCNFTDIIFKQHALNVIQGNLSLNQVFFNNASQIQNKRLLQQLFVQTPITNGSSLIQIQDSYLQISNFTFFQNINCTQSCNGGTLQLQNSKFSFSDTTFKSSHADFGGAIFINGIPQTNQINNCNFTQNNANYDGGAIYFNSALQDQFSLTIDQSKFTENVSENSKGGALFIYSSAYNSDSQFITISNSLIQLNKALVGGAIYNQNISPKSINNLFIDNKALIYGNDQISYPTELDYYNINQFLKDNENSTYQDGLLTISNFRSGSNLPTISLQFKNEETVLYPITDSDHQQYIINIDVFQAQQNPNYDVSGNLTTVYDQNTKSFAFNGINIIGTPNSSQYYEFKSDFIRILDPSTQKYTKNYSLKFQIKFRECLAGEEVQRYNQLIECNPCAENMYSLDSKGCKPCPSGANCLGGNNIVVENEYWRSSSNSDIIIKCDNQLSNCVGGSYGNNICFQGHIGALCEECDIYGNFWDSKYAKSGKYSCTNCNQITGNLYVVILLTAWTMLSMTIAIKADIETLENEAGALKIKQNFRKKGKSSSMIRPANVTLSKKKKFGNSWEDDDKAGVYIKMLTNYLQIVNSLSTFNLRLPPNIFIVQDSVGRPLQQTLNSMDCALAEIKINIPIIYLRVVVSIVLPIFYFLLFFVGVLVSRICTKNRSFPWYYLSTGIMFLIIYVQPDIVQQAISLQSCRLIGDQQYILGNVSFICNTNEHNQYTYFFLIPVLLTWSFLIPLILFIILWRKAESLDDIKVKLKYGFLFKEYKRWYWEFVKMTQKISIIIVLNFYFQDISVKGLVCFEIIIIYGRLAKSLQPYKEQVLNRLDEYSTICSAATILFGVFIYQNPYSYLVIIGFIFLVIVNAWYIVYMLLKILSGYIFKIKIIKHYFIQKLCKRYDFFKKFFPEKKQENRQVNKEIRQKIRNIVNKFIKFSPEEKRAFILKLYEQDITATHHPEYDKIKTSFIQKMDFYQFKQDSKIHSQAKNTTIVFNLMNESNNQQIEVNQNNEKLIIFDSEYSQMSVDKTNKIDEVVADCKQCDLEQSFQNYSKPQKTGKNSLSSQEKKTKDIENQKHFQINQPESLNNPQKVIITPINSKLKDFYLKKMIQKRKAQKTFVQTVNEYFPQHLAIKVPYIKRIDGKNVPNPQNKKTRIKSDKQGIIINLDIQGNAFLPIGDEYKPQMKSYRKRINFTCLFDNANSIGTNALRQKQKS